MYSQNEILKFIKKRFPYDCNWLSGNCYYFALILHNRFSNSEIYYDDIKGHFITKIQEQFYDWTGLVKPKHVIKWTGYKKVDRLHYNRIKRDVLD